MRSRPSAPSSYRRKRTLLAGCFVVLSLGVLYACLPDDPAWTPRYDYAPDPEASVTDTAKSDADAADADASDADAADGDASDPEAGDADLDAADAEDG